MIEWCCFGIPFGNWTYRLNIYPFLIGKPPIHGPCSMATARTSLFPTGGMDGHTAMHLAARFGQEKCVKTLARKLPDLVKARGLGKGSGTTSAMWVN